MNVWVGSGIGIVSFVSFCIIFYKARKPWWAMFIPIYNFYVLYQVVYGDYKGWYFLGLLIPFFNICLIVSTCLKLAYVFGRGTLFGLGLLFFPYLFLFILAAGNSQYMGDYYYDR